jgi:hypothetical protein
MPLQRTATTTSSATIITEPPEPFCDCASTLTSIADRALRFRKDYGRRVMFEPPAGLDVTENCALALSPGIVIVAIWWPL